MGDTFKRVGSWVVGLVILDITYFLMFDATKICYDWLVNPSPFETLPWHIYLIVLIISIFNTVVFALMGIFFILCSIFPSTLEDINLEDEGSVS